MTLFKPSGNCQGKRESWLWSAATTRRLIVGKSSYGINGSRNTVSLALLRPPHEGGSVRVSAQTRATESVVIMRLQMRETLDVGQAMSRNAENDKSKPKQHCSSDHFAGQTSFGRLPPARNINFTYRLSKSRIANEHAWYRGSASIYLSHSTNFDSIRSTTLSLALDSFDKYL